MDASWAAKVERRRGGRGSGGSSGAAGEEARRPGEALRSSFAAFSGESLGILLPGSQARQVHLRLLQADSTAFAPAPGGAGGVG
ncbi:MAG: hypothetical protein M3O15_08895 [Acidobacteriota bacterium]|nr:hypothetical protein [Acidobacteriota bacterium]